MTVNRRLPRGRKPRGEFSGKTKTFATRITPETRAALERAARRHGRSLSQEVEALLALGLNMREVDSMRGWRGRHLYALGRLIAYTAAHLEAVLGLYSHVDDGTRWREDPFAARALPPAVNMILKELIPETPDEEIKIPVEAKRYAERMASMRNLSPDEAVRYATPEEFGAMIGQSVILDLKRYAESKPYQGAEDQDAAIVDGEAAIFMPQVREALGLNKKREGNDK